MTRFQFGISPTIRNWPSREVDWKVPKRLVPLDIRGAHIQGSLSSLRRVSILGEPPLFRGSSASADEKNCSAGWSFINIAVTRLDMIRDAYTLGKIYFHFLGISQFGIQRNVIVVTVFLSTLIQMELHSAQNWKENCHHDHIPFNFERKWKSIFMSVHKFCKIFYPKK